MRYKTKIEIGTDDRGFQTLTNATLENAPYISGTVYRDVVSTKAMDFGAVGSSSLSFDIVNPNVASYEGCEVRFFVFPEDDGIETILDQIIEEVGDDEGEEFLEDDEVETDGEEDEGEEGEDLTPEEEAEVEADIEEETEAGFVNLDGEAEEVETLTTEEEEEDWTEIGTFYVYSQSIGNGCISITAFDGFCLLDDSFEFAGTFNEVAEELADRAGAKGVSFAYDELPTIPITINATGETIRSMAGRLASLMGGYASCQNGIELNLFANGDLILCADDMTSYSNTSAGDITIEGLSCNGFTVGEIADLSFDNPYMTEERLESILEIYNGIRISGAELSTGWTPALTAGTFARIMSANECREFLMLSNTIEAEIEDGEDPTQDQLYSLNAYGKIVNINSVTVDFSGDAIAAVSANLETITQRENPAPSVVGRAAKEALKIAGDTDQHFFFTETGADTGAHITEIPKGEFLLNPSGGNLLARSNGIAIRDGLEEVATFGGSVIELGKNINSSIIKFCGNNGTIKFGRVAGAALEVFQIFADEFEGGEVYIGSVNSNDGIVKIKQGRVEINGGGVILEVGQFDVSINSELTVEGHSTPIGTTIEPSHTSRNISSGTTYQDTDMEVSLDAGTWVISAVCNFAANTSGRRAMALHANDDTINHASMIIPAGSGVMRLNACAIQNLSEDTTISVKAWQNSGGSLAVGTYLRAVRIA